MTEDQTKEIILQKQMKLSEALQECRREPALEPEELAVIFFDTIENIPDIKSFTKEYLKQVKNEI